MAGVQGLVLRRTVLPTFTKVLNVPGRGSSGDDATSS
jgi:hypothetical protein